MRIVGSLASPDARRLREFAARNRLPHVWVDLDTDPTAALVLDHHSLGPEDTPIVVMRGGELHRNPSNSDVARAAGFASGPVPKKSYDVAVVGAGPAGLAASVYAASEGLVTAAIDALGVGGQIGTTSRIENYLGFPVGVSGEEFAERALIQVLRFGATLLVPAAAIGLSDHTDGYIIELASGEELVARSVIVATGVTYRRFDAVGLEQFEGLGVFYTPLTAHDQVDPGDAVVIVGGGNSAGQAATWLADHGHPVSMVIRGNDLAGSMSRYLIDRIDEHTNIDVRYHSVVRCLDGARRLERVVVEDLATSDKKALAAGALFVLIGAEAHTEWLEEDIELDAAGFIRTGPDLDGFAGRWSPRANLKRDPFLLESSRPGIFAAGDVRSGSVKRVASAVGEGSMAVRFVSEHLGHSTRVATAGPSIG
jgi:thioredoxin reductase (NADPH)